MNEVELILAARTGDLNSFNSLVLAYQELIYNHAYRMMGEMDAAEDATQNAFISAYRNIKSYRGGSFKAWLLRIVTNLCIDELRRRKRHPTVPLEPLDDNEEEIESPGWLTDLKDSPEENFEREELAKALKQCINSLTPESRAILILIDIQGLDYKEASQVIKRPLGTVKSRLARARLQLRDCMKGFLELLPVKFRLLEEDIA